MNEEFLPGKLPFDLFLFSVALSYSTNSHVKPQFWIEVEVYRNVAVHHRSVFLNK